MYNGVRRKSTMKLRKVLGSFAWVVLAAALILVNAAAANAQGCHHPDLWNNYPGHY